MPQEQMLPEQMSLVNDNPRKFGENRVTGVGCMSSHFHIKHNLGFVGFKDKMIDTILSLFSFQIGKKPRSSPVTLQEIKNTEAKV